MRLRARPGGWPVFLRIFALMLLMVLLVQTLNFALVILMPPPTPSIHMIDRVAAALRTGRDTGGTLMIGEDPAPPTLSDNPRDRRLERRIASALAVSVGAVRVTSFGPLPMGMANPARHEAIHALVSPPPFDRRELRILAGEPDRFRPGGPGMHMGEDLLFGPFTAAMRLPDGHWRSVHPTASGFEPWRWRALLWLIVAIAVVAPFAWLLARRLARPIGLFALAAERLGRDPRAPPLPLVGPPELADAAAAFNEMQARLNRYVEDRTTLIAAIAHDLRTPLMRLTMRLENAPPEIRIATEGDIREMDARIAAVMAFVRDMTRPARRQKLDLRSLAESVTDDFADRGDPVTLEPGMPVILEGDAPALKAVLSNLIGNAVKYAGRADVACRVEGDLAVIEVLDDGPGMPADDLESAFEPFFRGERSRARETGGIGLGLASVRAVARAHSGEATLRNRPEGGLAAQVTLPR